MTETTADIDKILDPSDILLALIVSLLAPMFAGVTAGDIDRASMAALETINACRARGHTDLIAVGHVIGFGLAALSSLSLSMAGDIPVSTVLRLRGSAIACNRSAEQHRRGLTRGQPDDPVARQAAAGEPEIAIPPEFPPATHRPEPAVFLSAAAEQQLAAESEARLVVSPAPTAAAARTPEEKRNQQMWAIAMAKESSEINASLPTLPRARRAEAMIRAAMLSSTAHDLIRGAPVTPPRPGTQGGLTRPVGSRIPPPR
jgi:hypothetical protein